MWLKALDGGNLTGEDAVANHHVVSATRNKPGRDATSLLLPGKSRRGGGIDSNCIGAQNDMKDTSPRQKESPLVLEI